MQSPGTAKDPSSVKNTSGMMNAQYDSRNSYQVQWSRCYVIDMRSRRFEISTSAERNAMKAHIKLGHIFGIEIGLHLSWFIIALLIVLSLADQFHAFNSKWGEGVIWSTAIGTSLLFFAAIIAHELSHAMVAKARRLPVRSITLFALGGVAQIEKEAGEASTEFWMGVAGPIMSMLIGVICLTVAWAFGWSPLTIPHTPLDRKSTR